MSITISTSLSTSYLEALQGVVKVLLGLRSVEEADEQQAIQWLRGLTHDKYDTWYKERLAELPPSLPSKRRSLIKRTLEQQALRWDNIEQDIQNPYSWASFTLSGGFF